jgi:thioredoxin reductase (NADPH)
MLALDERGYILTGRDVAPRFDDSTGEEYLRSELETSRPGVFAAGDVRCGAVERVASAVGEGAMSVRFVHRHLASQERLTCGTEAYAPATSA